MRILIASNVEAQDLFQDFSTTAHKVDICHVDASAQAINKFKPDLILLHCGCRVKYCLQKLSFIKTKLPSIPVIFLTRISAEHIAVEAFRLGAKDYFREPFYFPELHETINNLSKYLKKGSEKRKAAISPASIVTNHAHENLPPKIARVVCYMEKNLSRDISLDQLAKEAAMSKHHFCRVFKKHTGVSPMHFLTAKRIERAKILLLDEERAIGEVIAEVGFQDQSNFIKNFKKIEGVTPSFYRRDNLCAPNHH